VINRLRKTTLVLVATLALTACGGDKESNTVEGETDSSTPTASATSSAMADAEPSASASAGSSAGPSAEPSAMTSVAPKGSSALPGVPAVKNATDMNKEPEIAKGTGSDPTGLITRDLVVGTGDRAVASHTVKVRYVGALFADGSVFDSSWASGMTPAEFPLSMVVPGFAQGIVGMKVGGRREIVIPAPLGYRDQSLPGIPPNSTLVFVVDLTETGPAE
jgi:peptidylprolyl isomerase